MCFYFRKKTSWLVITPLYHLSVAAFLGEKRITLKRPPNSAVDTSGEIKNEKTEGRKRKRRTKSRKKLEPGVTRPCWARTCHPVSAEIVSPPNVNRLCCCIWPSGWLSRDWPKRKKSGKEKASSSQLIYFLMFFLSTCTQEVPSLSLTQEDGLFFSGLQLSAFFSDNAAFCNLTDFLERKKWDFF